MPLSFSNIFQAPKTSASPFSAAGAAPANPLPFSPLALQNQGRTVASPQSSGKPAPQAGSSSVAAPAAPGLTSEQVKSNLAAYTAKNPSTNGLSGGAQPVMGNTNPSPNMVGQNTGTGASTGAQPQVGGMFGALLGKSTQAYDQAGTVGQEAGQLRQAIARETQDVMGNPYYSGSVKVGQAGIIQQNQGSQLQALVDQQKAYQSQGAGYTANANAASPTQVSYGTQYVDPTTGQPISGAGGGTGSQAPQTQATNYANDVISGKRSYADAVSAMGLYGGAGKQFLDAAIKQSNPNFNFAQAETLGASQGGVGPAYQFAQTALTNAQAAIDKLSGLQKTNIPLVNAGANIFSTETGIGSEETRAVTGAIQTLRNAYASLLAANKGGTPTDYSAQANSEIPDKPTPNDMAAIKANFETLGGARAQIYGNPGSATGAPSGASGGGQASAGGFSFKQDANGNWVPA